MNLKIESSPAGNEPGVLGGLVKSAVRRRRVAGHRVDPDGEHAGKTADVKR
jgi:hypothetical protein